MLCGDCENFIPNGGATSFEKIYDFGKPRKLGNCKITGKIKNEQNVCEKIEIFKNRSFQELHILSQILKKYKYNQNKINYILKDLRNNNIDITENEIIYYIEKYK